MTWAILIGVTAFCIVILLRTLVPSLQIRFQSTEILVHPRNPLFAALCGNGDVSEIKKILIQHPDWINADLENQGTPLDYAVNYKRLDAIGLLLKMGADVNIVPPSVNEPLIGKAICTHNMAILSAIMDHGANLSVRDEYGRTMPELARYIQWPEAEQLLRARLLSIKPREKSVDHEELSKEATMPAGTK
jgi:ankyrin repeat protein